MQEENGFRAWLSYYIKPLDRDRRNEIISEIRVIYPEFPEIIDLFEEPGGSIISTITVDTILYTQNETMTFEGWIWIKVEDSERQTGWLPEIYLEFPNLTETITITPPN